MGKPLEEHLADFVLMMRNHPLSYRRECLQLWREKYGDQVAMRVEKLVRDRWKEPAR